MAVIFMGFILVFLICHSPRLFLNIHELATIRYVVGSLRPLALIIIIIFHINLGMQWSVKMPDKIHFPCGHKSLSASATSCWRWTPRPTSSSIASSVPNSAKNARNCTTPFAGSSVWLKSEKTEMNQWLNRKRKKKGTLCQQKGQT